MGRSSAARELAPEDIWRELQKRGYQGATDVKMLVRIDTPPSGLRLIDRSEAEAILAEVAGAAKVNLSVLRDMLTRLVMDPRTQGFEQFARVLAEWQEPDKLAPKP